MEDVVQVKALIPRRLKRQAFAALALRDEKFNRWLRTQMEALLQRVEAEKQESHDAQLAKTQACSRPVNASINSNAIRG
jgi:hypothetical protein